MSFTSGCGWLLMYHEAVRNAAPDEAEEAGWTIYLLLNNPILYRKPLRKPALAYGPRIIYLRLNSVDYPEDAFAAGWKAAKAYYDE
jgi:hypothetical protein